MANKNSAMQKIIGGGFRKGFEELVEAFESDSANEEIIAEMREIFDAKSCANDRKFPQQLKAFGEFAIHFRT